jgi:hypothetical protein
VGANFLRFNGVVLSVVGDIPFDSEVLVMTSSISRIYQLNLLEVFIEVGLRAYFPRGECAYVFVSVCVYTMFLKKTYISITGEWKTRQRVSQGIMRFEPVNQNFLHGETV